MNHKNFSQSTLAAAITDTTGTAITVTSGTTFPTAPFIISIDTEAMSVTSTGSGTNWTVTRGYEGSTAATHLNAAVVYHDISAAEADSIAAMAPLASPTFTGTPAAPTAVVDTNTTQLATTAMVLAQAASATPVVDGTAAVGTSKRYARGDHVHPTDTTRAAASAITNVDNTSDATKNAAAVTVTNHRFTRRVDAQATTDTITPEISTYDIFVRTAQAHALVINNHSSSTPVDGDMMLFEILSDATIRAITYGNLYVAKAGIALPAATVASKNLTLLFIWRNDLTKWNLLSAGQEA